MARRNEVGVQGLAQLKPLRTPCRRRRRLPAASRLRRARGHIGRRGQLRHIARSGLGAERGGKRQLRQLLELLGRASDAGGDRFEDESLACGRVPPEGWRWLGYGRRPCWHWGRGRSRSLGWRRRLGWGRRRGSGLQCDGCPGGRVAPEEKRGEFRHRARHERTYLVSIARARDHEDLAQLAQPRTPCASRHLPIADRLQQHARLVVRRRQDHATGGQVDARGERGRRAQHAQRALAEGFFNRTLLVESEARVVQGHAVWHGARVQLEGARRGRRGVEPLEQRAPRSHASGSDESRLRQRDLEGARKRVGALGRLGFGRAEDEHLRPVAHSFACERDR